MDEKSKQFMRDLSLNRYVNKPCPLCGQDITDTDRDTMVFAGQDEHGVARAAHKDCFDRSTADQVTVALTGSEANG